MNSLVNYFNCGQISESSEKSYVYFKVTKFSDIEGKIIPFLENILYKEIKD
jgi:hypothetical protein